MKKITLFKTVLIAATAISLSSCDNEQKKPEDSKALAEERNEAKFDSNSKKEKDAEFLVKATEINLEEIQLAQLALQNSTTADVKELAKMMEGAHKKSLNDLTVLASKKQISIPSSPCDKSKETYDELSKKTGIDFDKKYSDLMVSGHKDAIAAFEKASADSGDEDIREWANASLPDLRKHLDHAITCQRASEKM